MQKQIHDASTVAGNAGKPDADGLHFVAQTLRPFVRFFGAYPASRAVVAPLAELAPETRVALTDFSRMISMASRASGERRAIGLRVGRMVERGETGAVDYVAASAATLADAIAVTARNFRLVNDAVSVSVLRHDAHVLVRFDARVPWEPLMGDYLLSSIFSNHLRNQVSDPSTIEVWFAHPEPWYRDEYRTTFSPAQVRFDATCYGFVLPIREVERPQRDADRHLHAVMRTHVARLMIEQPNFTSFEGRVTQVLHHLLDGSQPPTARQVAARLEISTRTLARRLEVENTTFYAVLDRLRQRLAVDYVRSTRLALCDVSARLGFAHPAAFHRAFRRWTGTTPSLLRKAHEPRRA